MLLLCYDFGRLGAVGLLLAAFGCVDAAPAQTPQGGKKPNIVFILADDMSYDSVSALNPKMGPLKTPQIDRLIGQGMNFTDAHSGSAVCTPTRYGILTGRYCWRTRLKSSVLWEWGAPLIDRQRMTVAEVLQQRGYRTACVGKWHLGMVWPGKETPAANADLPIGDSFFKGQASIERIARVERQIDFTKPVSGPCDHGFDYYFGVAVPNFPPYIWIENDRLRGFPSVPKPDAMFGHPGPMLPGWKLEEILPTLAEKAAAWVVQESRTEAPFFLYLPLTSPHTPIAPSKPFQGKSEISAYADFLMETDAVVGRVMRALDEAGVAGETLLIFSTDNGTSPACNFKELESHGIDLHNHFRGHKAQIYEGGHRVPLVVRWPGKVKADSSCEETVCLNDFMATVADLLDYRLPDDAAEDSTSILPLLLGERARLPDHPSVVNHSIAGQFAIRRGAWKLVLPRSARQGRGELYDLDADPKETTNLVEKRPEVAAELTAVLKKYVERGRSTPGTPQKNHDAKTHWPGLPW